MLYCLLQGNPELGLVQARWSFVNKDENLLTRLQNINLCFHFEVEQQVNGVFLNFFGFNGTAGVWRIKALEESGGWLERTTVEDMDIAVRAHLNGWKFIYLNDVEVTCELPESYEAYKKQQHRWHSGPMQLFRLCLPSIIKSKVYKSKNLVTNVPSKNWLSRCLAFVVFRFLILIFADIRLEEGKFDLPLLSLKEADSTFLLIHTLLHHTSINNVHTRSRASFVDHLLRSYFHFASQHPPVTKIFPFLNPLPPFREHNVDNQVQCHDLWAVPARIGVRVGCDQENREIIRVRLASIC